MPHSLGNADLEQGDIIELVGQGDNTIQGCSEKNFSLVGLISLSFPSPILILFPRIRTPCEKLRFLWK